MASINYNGKKVNECISYLTDLDGDFNSLSSSLKEGLVKVISARGFDKYIGGIDSNYFEQYVEYGRSSVDSVIQKIRNTQIQILSFNQDDDEIKAFLDSLSVNDYKSLDLTSLEDHISFMRKAGNFFKGIGSFAGTLGTGAVEGVLEFGETGADLLTLGGTSVASIFTKGYDFFTGENVTEKMWEDTKAYVSKKHVESLFNSFYDDTSVGKYLKNNASVSAFGKSLGYKEGREFGKNVGYTTSIIATSSLTGIPMPLISGVMGFSRSTEDAWADGATIGKGLIYGTISGVWEAVQWQVGSKIDNLSKGVFATTKGNALKVILDSADAGIEGFVQPIMNMTYKDYEGKDFKEQYANAFKANGGWSAVASQVALGGFMSAGSKIFQSAKNRKTLPTFDEYETSAGIGGIGLAIKNRFLERLDDSKASFGQVSEQNRQIAQSISKQIDNNGSYIFKCNRSKELSAEVLRKLDDYGNLDKVKVVIDGPFKDSNGNYKTKYNKSHYTDRVTYTGYEALSIVSKLDELQSRIDMSLPTKQRAHQIYEVLADEYGYMYDFKNYADGHKVASSLRGLTSNNSIGKKGLVCAGYAQAYSELCDRCGIKCEYIRGNAITPSGKNEKHAWNVFFDDNGEQIPVDVTWKSGSSYDEWFGKSKKFAESHVADSDEIFRDYSPSVNVSSFESSTTYSSLEKIIDTMDRKYGLESGYKSLKKYMETGNVNCITRTNGCRDIIKTLDFDDINSFLLKNDYNYASSILGKYANQMDAQYGKGSGKYALQVFLTGKNNVITRSNNFRHNISTMPSEFIEYFINGG